MEQSKFDRMIYFSNYYNNIGSQYLFYIMISPRSSSYFKYENKNCHMATVIMV